MTFGCGEFTVTDAASAAAANAPRRTDDCNDCTELKVNDSCVRLNSAQSTSQQLPPPPLPSCLPTRFAQGNPPKKAEALLVRRKLLPILVVDFGRRFALLFFFFATFLANAALSLPASLLQLLLSVVVEYLKMHAHSYTYAHTHTNVHPHLLTHTNRFECVKNALCVVLTHTNARAERTQTHIRTHSHTTAGTRAEQQRSCPSAAEVAGKCDAVSLPLPTSSLPLPSSFS